MGEGVYRKRKLWAAGGRIELEALVLDPWASRRKSFRRSKQVVSYSELNPREISS